MAFVQTRQLSKNLPLQVGRCLQARFISQGKFIKLSLKGTQIFPISIPTVERASSLFLYL